MKTIKTMEELLEYIEELEAREHELELESVDLYQAGYDDGYREGYDTGYDFGVEDAA